VGLGLVYGGMDGHVVFRGLGVVICRRNRRESQTTVARRITMIW